MAAWFVVVLVQGGFFGKFQYGIGQLIDEKTASSDPSIDASSSERGMVLRGNGG
jgi:hypothetical protein